MALRLSGFAKAKDGLSRSLTVGMSKLESIAGATMTRQDIEFTVINTDLWQHHPRTPARCQLCGRTLPLDLFSGADGFEIHASETSLETVAGMDLAVPCLYHALAHVTILYCGLPREKWFDAVRDGESGKDTLRFEGRDYSVQKVVV